MGTIIRNVDLGRPRDGNTSNGLFKDLVKEFPSKSNAHGRRQFLLEPLNPNLEKRRG